MRVDEIGPGLWRWTARHEEWGEDVGCVYHQAPDAVVLVDPLVPPEDAERFWEALDRDVGQAGVPVHVLITIYWHCRSADEVAARYGARIWAHRPARAPIRRRVGGELELFEAGDALPGGVEAFVARGSEVVYWIPRHGALVAGDVILGGKEGGLRLCPPSWHPHGGGHDRVRENLRPLLALPVERVLVSHGEPVLAGALEAFERLVGREAGAG